MTTRSALRFLIPVLSLVLIGGATVVGVAGATRVAVGRAALAFNPCQFLDPGNPGKLMTTDTLFTSVIGKYRPGNPPAVSISAAAGPDYQDGWCVIDGGLTYSEPASDCGGSSPCSPLYGAYALETYPIAEMTSQLVEQRVDQFWPSKRHISGAGADGTEACDKDVTVCVAWFTKGTKFVFLSESNLYQKRSSVIEGATYVNTSYGMNGSSNIRGTVEKVIDIAYDHMSAWSTRNNPNGSP
jgi:hypothetical protein